MYGPRGVKTGNRCDREMFRQPVPVKAFDFSRKYGIIFKLDSTHC